MQLPVTEITPAEARHSEISEIVETCQSLTTTLIAAIEPEHAPKSYPHWAIVKLLKEQLEKLSNTI